MGLLIKRTREVAKWLVPRIVVLAVASCWVVGPGAPVHEAGHVLACWAFGVQVLKVEWFRVTANLPPHSSQLMKTAIGAAGGFLTGLVLLGFCIALGDVAFPPEGDVSPESRKNKIFVLVEIARVSALAAAGAEFGEGILEGFAPGLYRLEAETSVLLIIILAVASYLSLEFERKKIEKIRGSFTNVKRNTII